MPSFAIVQNTQAGNFQSDGTYMTTLAVQGTGGQGPTTNQCIEVGAASWGPLNILTPHVPGRGGSNVFGIRTDLIKSLVRTALSAAPECSNHAGIRTSDGTHANASMVLNDAVPAAVLNFTAVFPGTDGNGASVRCDLTGGTSLTVGPVLSITIYWIDGSAQTWNNIIAYATPGGTYDAPTFLANAVAAVNGHAPNQVPSPYFVCSAGSSTAAPVTGVVAKASGGLNGDSGVSDTTNLGSDLMANSTGAYAGRGQMWGSQLLLAGLSTPSLFAAVDQLCSQEGCEGWFTFPAGTQTGPGANSAVSLKASNNLSSDNMNVMMDWNYVYDSYQVKQILVPPSAKAAGIVSSLDPFEYPSNKPDSGAKGVSQTERLALGAISLAERGLRQSNNINWIDNQNGKWVLAHGLTSSGRQINEIRMQKYIMFRAGQIAAQYQGGLLESSLTFAQADEKDARKQLYSALLGLKTELSDEISGMDIVLGDVNNTPTTMQQGFLMFELDVQTKAGVQFVVGATKVGNAVQIASPSLPTAA